MRSRASGSTPRRPGAVLGNDPVPTGGGRSGSWACRARPQPARRSEVTNGSCLRISGQDQGGGTLTSPSLSSPSAVSPLIFNVYDNLS